MSVEAIFFQRRTDGTGSTIGNAIQIGKLPGSGPLSFAQPEYRKSQQGAVIRWEIDVPVIPFEPTGTEFDLSLMRDAINAYLSSILGDMNFAPVEVRTLPNGKVYIAFRNQQRGDLIVQDFNGTRTIETDVVISDARIIEEEVMMAGGMVVRFIFVKEATLQRPSQRWCSFRIRAGGTGSESAQVNLVDSGVQSSRLTTFDRESNGIQQRLLVRAWYSSEAGSRTLSAIQSYIDSKKTEMLWAPPVLKVAADGRGIYLNTRNNFGDVTLDSAHGGSASVTLLQNCTLEDARVINSDEAGGVQIEFAFVNVRPEYQPTLRYFRFRMRNNGAGSHKKTVPLGINDPESAWLGELQYLGQGRLTIARVRTWMPNDHGVTTLLNVQAKAEGIRNDCEFIPPIVKDLPRGKAVMPNIQNNFGDLMYHSSFISSSDSTGTVVLANCTMMEPPRVFDSLNEGGVGMEFIFGRVADSNKVTS